MVKNEEIYVKRAIESVLPFVRQVIVYDTGSTDNTIKEIKSIRSNKILLFKSNHIDANGLTSIRNKMISQTKTEWFMIVDGDEIYDESSLLSLLFYLPYATTEIKRIVVERKNLLSSCFGLLDSYQYLGRIYRTKHVMFIGAYPNENPIIKNESKKSHKVFETIKPMIYHYHSFIRSTVVNENKLGNKK